MSIWTQTGKEKKYTKIKKVIMVLYSNEGWYEKFKQDKTAIAETCKHCNYNVCIGSSKNA